MQVDGWNGGDYDEGMAGSGSDAARETDGAKRQMRTLVLGLGNPIVSDDAVGLRVVAALKPLLAGRSDVEVGEDYWGGLRLMERLEGFQRAVVIDAIVTGSPPGTVHRLSVDDIATQRSASAHDVNLPTAMELGRQAGLSLPANADVLLVGIEAADILTFSEDLTPAVAEAVPQVVRMVLEVLEPPASHMPDAQAPDASARGASPP